MRAGAVRAVEGEGARLQLLERLARLRVRQFLGEEMIRPVHLRRDHHALAVAQGRLHAVRQAGAEALRAYRRPHRGG